jgi:two-component system response regulator ChvI
MARVLLVDDDAEVLAAWGAICAADGFEVRSASNGQAALDSFVESPVDVVVADWRMPEMSGSELCHRLRTLPGLADVAFILISGEPTPPAFVSYDGFLRKPVDAKVLLATMHRLMVEHVTHRETRSGNAN